MTNRRKIGDLLKVTEWNGVDIENSAARAALSQFALEALTTGTQDQRLALAGLLREFTEAYEAHVVSVARESGASWADIGSLIGVSKQAIHQKYAAQEAIPSPLGRERYLGRSVSIRCTECRAHIGLSHTGDTASLSAKVIQRHEQRKHCDDAVDKRAVAKAKDQLRSGDREATAGRYRFIS